MRFTTFFKAAAPYVAMALFVSLINPAVATAAAMDIELKASDGTALKATYRSPGRPGPAMLLIHQCNMDRSSWDELATALVDTGVHVLTMDLRGFGESEGEGLQGAGGFQTFMQTSTTDVDMAYEYLIEQSGVDVSRVAVGGASCGAMLTADLASRQAGIKTLMLLSGPPSEGAIAHIAATPSLAVFAAAARGDAVVAGIADLLQGAVDGSKHPRSTAKIYDGTEHGLPMFEKNADLEPALLSWLNRELLGD